MLASYIAVQGMSTLRCLRLQISLEGRCSPSSLSQDVLVTNKSYISFSTVIEETCTAVVETETSSPYASVCQGVQISFRSTEHAIRKLGEYKTSVCLHIHGDLEAGVEGGRNEKGEIRRLRWSEKIFFLFTFPVHSKRRLVALWHLLLDQT